MNWYKIAKQNFESMDAASAAVQRSLMALKYQHPDLDPATAGVTQLAASLADTGTVPAGVSPERYAAMVIFHARNGEELSSL